MFLKKWAGMALAVLGIAAVFSLYSGPALAAPAIVDALPAIASMKPYAALVLAVGLEPLRAQHAALKARADAKLAEVKDGMAADALAKIETDHAAILADLSAVQAAIGAEEKKSPPAPKAWAAGFYASASDTGMTLAQLNEIVTASASHDEAKDALIRAMAKRNENKPGPGGNPAIVVADARDKFVEGATRALMAATPILSQEKTAERNEFSDMSLIELARMSLDRSGIRLQAHGRDAVINAVFAPMMSSGGMHSTSDFVNILSNVANKSMLKGFEETEETFGRWTSKGSLRDFKPTTRVDIGLFGTLDVVREGGEYTFGTISDRKDTAVLATYGKMFGITRQVVINDDLSAFTKVPNKMGRAAKRTVGNLVYGILTMNPNMADGVALFHANHGNLATGGGSAIGVDSLDAGRSAMAKQKDPDSKAVALGIRPKFLLVPVSLEGKSLQLVNSTADPSQANPNVANRVAKIGEVIPEARLDAASLTAWYLAASPGEVDTIEVLYLNGQETPTLEQKVGWTVDEVQFKVRLDAAAKCWEHRGLYKGAGA